MLYCEKKLKCQDKQRDHLKKADNWHFHQTFCDQILSKYISFHVKLFSLLTDSESTFMNILILQSPFSELNQTFSQCLSC